MATYTYNPMVAVNPEVAGSVIINGSGKVYAPEDTGFTTPLTIRLLNGTVVTSITTNARGLTQAFTIEDYPSVIFKDDGPGGTAPLDSARGVIEEVLARTADAEASAAAAAQSAEDAANVTDAGVFGILNDPATQAGDALRRLAQQPNPYVEGVPLYNIGHSYTMYPYPYATQFTGEYYMRIKQRLNMGDVYPLGRSATIAADNFGRLISDEYDGGRAYWTPGRKGVCLIQNTMNELGSSLAADTKYRNLWRMGILGEIAIMSSASTLGYAQRSAESAAWTRMTTQSAKKALNGETYFIGTAGGWVEWSVTGTEAYLVAPVSVSYGLQPFQVLIDGTVALSVTPMGAAPAYNDAVTGVQETFTPGIWRLTFAQGTHTIRFRHNGASGNAFFSGLIVPAKNPPRIFIGKEPPRIGSGQSTYDANIAWYNAEIDALAAMLPHVTAVDLAAGWDNSTMVSSLDTGGGSFHPNDKGHAKMADHFAAAINATITDWVDGVVVL